MEQDLFEYLKEQLVTNNGFEVTGKHSLFYTDDRDTIFIYIANNQFTLISDGPEVISQIESRPLVNSKEYFDFEEDWYSYLNQEFLQLVLHRF